MSTAVLAAAFLVVAASFAPGAAAQSVAYNKTCVDNYPPGVLKCVRAYMAVVTAEGATKVSTCDSLTDYFSCLADVLSCDPVLTPVWNVYFLSYSESWKEDGCTSSPTGRGSSFGALGWGDPHYTMVNGSMVTCNAPGWNILAVSSLYRVEVLHSREGPIGSIIAGVRMTFAHPAFPNGTFTWTPNSSPSSLKKSGVTLNKDGVSADAVGLQLIVKRSGSYLSIGIAGLGATGGIIVNGCPGESYPPMAIPSKCAAFGTEALRSACAFDAKQTNISFAVAATSASATLSTEVQARKTAQSTNGVAAAAAGLAAAILTVAVTAALF